MLKKSGDLRLLDRFSQLRSQPLSRLRIAMKVRHPSEPAGTPNGAMRPPSSGSSARKGSPNRAYIATRSRTSSAGISTSTSGKWVRRKWAPCSARCGHEVAGGCSGVARLLEKPGPPFHCRPASVDREISFKLLPTRDGYGVAGV